MRFNRRSANPLEWISVDFFSKGRALDPSFLRFLMSMTWQMKTPTFRAAVSLEEFVRDRTKEEDKEAKDTFLLAHRFLYDSCPQGLRLEVAGGREGATTADDDTDGDANEGPKGQQQHQIMAPLEEWEARGLVITLETSPAKKVVSLAREALDLITYDSPLLPSILHAMTTQRPEATQQYRRIIAKEANSRTCFFRLYKNSRFLTLFGPLKPDLAALIEAAPASYYSSSSSGFAAAAGGGGGGGSSTGSSSSSSNATKRPRARGSVYSGFKKRPCGEAAASSSLKKSAGGAAVKKSSRRSKREQDDFYYYDDNYDLGDEEEEEEEEKESSFPDPYIGLDTADDYDLRYIETDYNLLVAMKFSETMNFLTIHDVTYIICCGRYNQSSMISEDWTSLSHWQRSKRGGKEPKPCSLAR